MLLISLNFTQKKHTKIEKYNKSYRENAVNSITYFKSNNITYNPDSSNRKTNECENETTGEKKQLIAETVQVTKQINAVVLCIPVVQRSTNRTRHAQIFQFF